MADAIPTDQLLELLVQMKAILTNTGNSQAGIEQVRAIINTHPQLAYGLIKTMVTLDIVDEAAFAKTLTAKPPAPVPAPPPLPAPVSAPVVPTPPLYHQPPPPPQRLLGSYQPPRQQGFRPPQPQPGPSGYPGQGYGAPYPPPSNEPRLPYQQPQPQLPPAAMNLPAEQQELVRRVLSLTPAQIAALPPSERDTFTKIRQQLLGRNA